MERKRSRFNRLLLRPFDDPVAETIRKNVLGRSGSVITSMALCAIVVTGAIFLFDGITRTLFGEYFRLEMRDAIIASVGHIAIYFVYALLGTATLFGLIWPILLYKFCHNAINRRMPLEELAVIPNVSEILAAGFKKNFLRLALPGLLAVLIPSYAIILGLNTIYFYYWSVDEMIFVSIFLLSTISHCLLSCLIPYSTFSGGYSVRTLSSSIRGWGKLALCIIAFTPVRYAIVSFIVIMLYSYTRSQNYSSHQPLHTYGFMYHWGPIIGSIGIIFWYSIELLITIYYGIRIRHYRKNFHTTISNSIEKSTNRDLK